MGNILNKLGYNDAIERLKHENKLKEFEIGRVVAEHKERYIVKTEAGDLEAEITGNLRFSAQSREDFPAVGDWVALMIYDADSAIIHKVLPRLSVLSRQAAGGTGELQIIASNVDYAFIVQAVDRDFNINRLERYLTICNASQVKPIIVLTKTDLIEEQKIIEIQNNIKQRIKNLPILAISNENQYGYETMQKLLESGKTYCMLGSSGVGKSTLLNNLVGKSAMKTNTISQNSNKGRHTTSHRELVVLDNGAIFIDNPGMREVGIADAATGLETTFDRIIAFSQTCRFKDCTHTNELGCAVLEAVKNGEIERASYENFLKMEREKAHFESTTADRRKKGKTLSKIVKNYKKDMKRNED